MSNGLFCSNLDPKGFSSLFVGAGVCFLVVETNVRRSGLCDAKAMKFNRKQQPKSSSKLEHRIRHR